MNLNKKNIYFVVLLFLSGLSFVIYSFLYNISSPLFNSPDESLNYFFIDNFAKNSSLYQEENLNSIANNLVHPRSTLVLNNKIVPVGFVGIVLILGFISKIIGIKLALFCVPLLACIVPVLLYYILKEIFDDKIAFFSSLMLYFHPAFIYYSSRSLLPNVLFISFLIISIFFVFLFKNTENLKIKYLAIILSSLSLSLSLITRLSEVVWVFVIYLFLLAYVFKKLNLKYIILFLCVFLVPMLFMLKTNYNIYGHPLSTGYCRFGNSLQEEVTKDIDTIEIEKEMQDIKPLETNNNGEITGLLKFIFPFGIKLGTSWNNFYSYFITIFWWLFIPMIMGIIYFFKLKLFNNKIRKYYFVLATFLLLYLTIYYGSWTFFDNINKTITIGNSYIRYWLILYIIFLPFVGIGLFGFLKRINSKLLKLFLGGLFTFITIVSSFSTAMYFSEEGVLNVAENIKTYKYQLQQVTELTEPESIIITARMDKILFPTRKVMVLDEMGIIDNIGVINELLKKNIPLYVYSEIKDDDAGFLNMKYLNAVHISLILKSNIYNDYSLYELVKW